jgi:hypothetical protein
VSDLGNDFGLKQHIVGDGFEAERENYYATQLLSVGVNRKFWPTARFGESAPRQRIYR